ncbi:hypothetical protein DFH09DRAFT_1081975 [Mycena vulgaris]|nr:hypothetical protein DFH09DRAFT_1081975 [Mycena vulgaris]
MSNEAVPTADAAACPPPRTSPPVSCLLPHSLRAHAPSPRYSSPLLAAASLLILDPPHAVLSWLELTLYSLTQTRLPRRGHAASRRSHDVRMASHSCALTPSAFRLLVVQACADCTTFTVNGTRVRTQPAHCPRRMSCAQRRPRIRGAWCASASWLQAQSRIARRHASRAVPASYACEACGACNPARREESLNERAPRLCPRKRDAGAMHLRLLPHRGCA